MLAALLVILHGAVSTLRTHRDLLVEIAALRQQLAIYKRTAPRPKLRVPSASVRCARTSLAREERRNLMPP